MINKIKLFIKQLIENLPCFHLIWTLNLNYYLYFFQLTCEMKMARQQGMSTFQEILYKG
jgi:hypothetical protein